MGEIRDVASSCFYLDGFQVLFRPSKTAIVGRMVGSIMRKTARGIPFEVVLDASCSRIFPLLAIPKRNPKFIPKHILKFNQKFNESRLALSRSWTIRCFAMDEAGSLKIIKEHLRSRTDRIYALSSKSRWNDSLRLSRFKFPFPRIRAWILKAMRTE